ncbi:MAG: hypothetical protein Q4B70_18600, partial [Lachnospiraceae bacterium]|nr:hypothetical protein [Lachnospiraceae bacterium]
QQRYKHLVVSKGFERLRVDGYEKVDSIEDKKLRVIRSIQAEGGFVDVKEDRVFTNFFRVEAATFIKYTLHNISCCFLCYHKMPRPESLTGLDSCAVVLHYPTIVATDRFVYDVCNSICKECEMLIT